MSDTSRTAHTTAPRPPSSPSDGDRAPHLGDDAIGDGDHWRVVGLATAHGEVAQIQNAATHEVVGVFQDASGAYRLRVSAYRVWFSPPAPTVSSRRRPQVGDKVAMADGTDSGYQVAEVAEQVYATGYPRWVLLRRVANRSFVVIVRPAADGRWGLNGHELTFLSDDHRVCDECEEFFVPEPFGDPEICDLCAEAAADDALSTVVVPNGTLEQLRDSVLSASYQLRADGHGSTAQATLTRALSLLDQLTGR